MTEKQSSLLLEQSQVYSIQNQTATEIIPAKKWSLQQQADRLHLNDGDAFSMEFSKEVVRIKYKDSQIFYLKNGNTYLALFLPLNCEQIDVIQYKFQENSIKIVQWQSTNKRTQDDLKQICGKKIGQQFTIKSSIKNSSLTFKIGGFFGALNALIAKPTKKINEVASSKLQNIKEQKISEQTKGKWKRFKDKAKQLNHGAAEVLRPAREKLVGVSDKIGDKFDKSENVVIKGIRNFGNKLKDSLNEGYRNSMRGEANSNELKQQVVLNQQLKTPESNRNLN